MSHSPSPRRAPVSATRLGYAKGKGENVSESRTVFKSSHYAIDIETEGDKVILRRIYWPLTYAGNYQKDEIVLTPDSISVHERWDGWARYGQLTGACTSADVEITKQQYEKLKQLMLNVKNVDDFEKLIDKIRDIQKDYEDKINAAIDEFINEIQNLDFVKKKLEMIKDPERRKEFIEQLWDDIDEYFSPEP